MDLDFSAEDLAFRDEVRAFIKDAFDDDMRAHMAQSKNGHIDKAGQVRWLKRLNDKGWIVPDWPVEYGGTGWSPARSTSTTWRWRWPARPPPPTWASACARR